MPAKDRYHDAVKAALIKDGWTITHDPYRIEFGTDNLYADLAAERAVVAAERDVEKIAVEIGSVLICLPNSRTALWAVLGGGRQGCFLQNRRDARSTFKFGHYPALSGPLLNWQFCAGFG